jgi:hypothetical protein
MKSLIEFLTESLKWLRGLIMLVGTVTTSSLFALFIWAVINWDDLADVSLTKYWNLVRKEHIIEQNDRMQQQILEDLTEREAEVSQRESDLNRKLAKK